MNEKYYKHNNVYQSVIHCLRQGQDKSFGMHFVQYNTEVVINGFLKK